MKIYIDKYIVTPLDEAVQKGNTYRYIDFKGSLIYSLEQCCNHGRMEELSEAMQPFYDMYVYANPCILGYEKAEIRVVIRRAIELDPYFYNHDDCEDCLFISAGRWAEHLKNQCYSHNTNDYFLLLESMSVALYDHPCPVNSDYMRKKLVREKIEGNSYSREVYCILHAFLTIWEQRGLTSVRKQFLFRTFKNHWCFIRAIYSAMLQRVVGYGYHEFAAITHCVKSDARHHRYLHLFYSAMMEHKEKIIGCGTKRDKLDNALEAVREIVGKTKASGELDDLCRILFSDKLKQYLDKHRPKTYRELEMELDTLHDDLKTKADEMQRLIDKQVEMLSGSSISIEVIADELKKMAGRFPGMAYEVYEKLNALLVGNEVWMKNAVVIRDMIWEKMQQPSIKAEHYYAQGAVHQDASRHITMKDENKLIG